MNDYLTLRMQQRVQILYRYANALDRGDIDVVAAALHEAESDQVLERMIMEINDVYQDEDHVSVDSIERMHSFLLTQAFSQGIIGEEAINRSLPQRNTLLLPQRQNGTPERMQQNVKIQKDLSQPLQEEGYIPARPSNRSHRFWILIQSLAAVLVVGALLGSFLLLFASHRTETGHSGNAGGTWRIVKSPDPFPGNNSLNAVTSILANDVWAVGSTLTGPQQTIIEHWNGTSWSVVESPNPGLGGKVLNAVAAVSTNDAWAVGSFSSSGIGDTDRTLIEHWNGANWSVIESPSPDVGDNILHGVVAISANDAWAVGESFSFNNHLWRTLIEHWNGTNWSVVPSPGVGEGATLTAVTAVSANNVWAVGNISQSGKGRGPVTLIEHWNGANWGVVPGPAPGRSGNFLSGVAAVSANDVWAVGNYFTAGRDHGRQALIEHWNGANWSVVSGPHLSAGLSGDTLIGVTVVSTNDIWAVGYAFTEQGMTGGRSNATLEGLIEHWNGTGWSVVKNPSYGSTGSTLYGVSANSANNIWAVGVEGATGAQTLTEHYSP